VRVGGWGRGVCAWGRVGVGAGERAGGRACGWASGRAVVCVRARARVCVCDLLRPQTSRGRDFLRSKTLTVKPYPFCILQKTSELALYAGAPPSSPSDRGRGTNTIKKSEAAKILTKTSYKISPQSCRKEYRKASPLNAHTRAKQVSCDTVGGPAVCFCCSPACSRGTRRCRGADAGGALEGIWVGTTATTRAPDLAIPRRAVPVPINAGAGCCPGAGYKY